MKMNRKVLTFGSVSSISMATAMKIKAQSHTERAVAKLLDLG